MDRVSATATAEKPVLPPENINGHTKKVRYIQDRLAELVQRKPHARVLDFGCGNGSAVSQYLIAELPETSTYLGVDIHPDSVSYANTHFARPSASFTDKIPDDERFDAVVYADVLEHLDRPQDDLVSHHNLLDPGGIIVGSIPNGVGPFEIESTIDRRFQISNRIARMMARLRKGPLERIPYNSDSGHLQFYRKTPFLRMLSDAGFDVTDFRNGAFVGAMVSERFLRFGGQPFMRANTAIVDYLPHWAVSTWLFTAEKP
jgi:2-polyprenyl-3-methyl-5-hydroxy-6-metoxy-1,4-benzoquinol methylase